MRGPLVAAPKKFQLGWGALYGAAWWVVGGLVLMPILLGMPALAPLTMPPMRPVAMGSLVGHLTYGLILGGVYVGFVRRSFSEAAAPATFGVGPRWR